MSASVRPIAQLGFAIIGGVIGGPIGFAVGNLVGGLLFGPKQQSSPVQSLEVETSDYGVFLKEFYGTMATAGNVIDCRYKDGKPYGVTTKKKKISAKGTGAGAPANETEIIEYYLTAAYALGKGPLDVDKIWMEDDGERKLIYNRYGETKKKRGYELEPEFDIFGNIVAELSDKVQVYRGLESQPINPVLQEFHPDGVPAYIGVAYVLFNKLRIKSIPRFTFLVRNAITGRREIVQHRLERCKTPSSRIVLNQISGTLCGAVVAQREGAAPLCDIVAATSLCDMASIDGMVTDRNRQSPLLWPLVEEELGAYESDSATSDAPERWLLSTINEKDLPSRLKGNFQNPALDYASDMAQASRVTAQHVNEQSVDFPIAAHHGDMATLMKVLLNEQWAAKDSVEVSLLPHRIKAAPGDVFVMPGNDRNKYLRIGEQSIGPDGLLHHKTNSYDPAVYGQYPVNYVPPFPPSEVDVYEEPTVFIQDIVAITDEMTASPGYISGVTVPAYSMFDGAQLQSEGLGMTSYAMKATIGKTTNSYSFSEEETTRFNYDKAIRIELIDGELSSSTEHDVRNKRANIIVIGELVLQFVEAQQVGDFEYEITGLLPGRDGSDYFNNCHAGTPVMLITSEGGDLEQGVTWTPVDYPVVNTVQEYTVVMNSPHGEFTGPANFTVKGNSVKTLSPVHVHVSEKSVGSFVKIKVSPRTRLQPNSTWAMTNQSDPMDFRLELRGNIGTLVKNYTGTNELMVSWSELSSIYTSVPATFTGKVQGKNNLTGLGFTRSFEGI